MSYGPPPPGNPGPPPPPGGGAGGYGPPTGGYGPPSGGPGGPSGYGPPGYGGQPGGTPPDNGLVWAIVAIFCCWAFAIPAIVNAAKVNDLWNRGDQAGAYEAQASAKKWTKVAFIVGVVIWVLSIGFNVLSVMLAASVAPYS